MENEKALKGKLAKIGIPRRVRIVNDGGGITGTRVLNADTGEELDIGIGRIVVDISANAVTTAKLTLYMPEYQIVARVDELEIHYPPYIGKENCRE
jgi:hypothetical protein